METKKVIEQGDEYDITINIQEGYISLSQTDDLSTDVVIIRPAYTTEVAKAIAPKYQETEDENKILKNQIELIFKNANNKIESLEQKNAKLSELLSDYSRNTEQQLAEKDKEIEGLKNRNYEEIKNSYLRFLNNRTVQITNLRCTTFREFETMIPVYFTDGMKEEIVKMASVDLVNNILYNH